MKKYERLTKRNSFGEVEVSGKYDDDILRKYHEIAKRLAEFEDKIELKQLVELRCGVVSNVYFVNQEEKRVEQFKIEEIIIMKKGICFELESKENSGLDFFFESDFDKCWFTDKGKAELKLKDLIKEKKNEKKQEHDNDTKKHCNSKRN